MTTPAQALQAILDAAPLLPARSLALERCRGEILRETLVTDRPMPPFDRVAMDGFAIQSAGFTGSARMEGMCPAGAPQAALTDPRNALEVMTGAMLPIGCDTVIPVEWVRRETHRMTLREGQSWTPGQFLHRTGSDLPEGAPILGPGTRLLAPHIAIAATLGKLQLAVSTRPRIALVTTGDEIVPVSATPLPHQIRASNPHALAASLQLAGFDAPGHVHLRDDRPALESGLRTALGSCDVLLITGGVSAGAFDFIPEILPRTGAQILFHKVEQRPGRPLLFAKGQEGQLVFGLPGNPLSCLVCLHRYVLPALFHMMAAPLRARPVTLGPGFASDDHLTIFKLVRVEDGSATPLHNSGSGDLATPALSDGFVELPPGLPVAEGGRAAFFAWAYPGAWVSTFVRRET
ncbi:MAG: molybdopterin molybdotransferase MoeA [Kiritimatiellia bacterium]